MIEAKTTVEVPRGSGDVMANVGHSAAATANPMRAPPHHRATRKSCLPSVCV
jgi:hypothetical protein